jgi:hypothetical protein
MPEHLSQHSYEESQVHQAPEAFDAPELASESEIQQAKDEAAVEHATHEQARQPSVDEARAAVDAAMADMNQPLVLGRKQKLRQLAGFNAYSKKENKRLGQERAEQNAHFWQANETYQKAFVDDNLQRSHETFEAKMEAMNQQYEQSPDTVPVVETDDALAAAEASIAFHADNKTEQIDDVNNYPPEAKSLVRAMEHEGTNYRYEAFDPSGELGEAYDGMFILDNEKKADQEPTVRIYRGVREVNDSVLKQSPPVLKGLDTLYKSYGNPSEREALRHRKEEVKAKIFTFLENPTLDNLKSYVDDLTYQAQFESPHKQERLKEQMKRIQTAVTETGVSVEQALREEHVMSFSGGDNLQIDISPFIAASPDAEAAGFYADGALLAIDVPASQIAGYGELGEVLIKGELTAENIAGVAVRRSNKTGLKQHASGAHKQAAAMIQSGESVA